MNPRHIVILLLFGLCQNHVAYAQRNKKTTTPSNWPHTNIKISSKNDPNEPSICLDPKHPNYIVAGSNIANIYTSSDTGRTWQTTTQSSSYGVWGDPDIEVDTAGNFYHFHLSNPEFGNWIDRIVCQKSTNHGQKWSNGTYSGLRGKKNQDKHWVDIDRQNNAIYMTWTQFDAYESRKPTDRSNILFSKSTDGGETWSPAARINQIDGDCLDDDDTVEGAVPAVGPNGEIYVAWAGPTGIRFDRSLNGGKSWLKNDRLVAQNPGGWALDIPAINRCNGLPTTACDVSQSPYRGNIYINWADQRNGQNDTDIWLARSTDGGKTWSKAARVNDDTTHTHQFLTWLEVDQATGYLWFVFYDRRNHTDNHTDVYMAVSTDGGNTFKNFRVSEQAFLPRKDIFFGDYNGLTVHNNIVRPIWTSLDTEAKLSVWTAIIDVNAVLNTKN